MERLDCRRQTNEDRVMKVHKHFRTYLLLCNLVVFLQPLNGFAQSNSDAAKTNQTLKARDGQHDFDFEIGTWRTHLKRLLHPLTGSATWVEYDGTTVVRRVWNGRANLVELEVDGPSGQDRKSTRLNSSHLV